MPLILNVLKPFDDSLSLENKPQFKKSTSSKSPNVAYFFENMLKNQSDLVSIDTLLNKNISIVAFKPYFEQFYKFSETFSKLEHIIKDFNNLKQATVKNQLINIVTQTSSLNNQFVLPSKNQLNSQNNFTARSQIIDDQDANPLVGQLDEFNTKDLNDINSELNQSLKSEPINEESNVNEIVQNHGGIITIESLYDQKFYLGLLHIPSLM
jgi:hypothetical protein